MHINSLTEPPCYPFTHLPSGKLTFHNDRKMSWQWFRNVDGNKVLRDEVTICNTAEGMSVSCGNGAAKLDKINPGRSARNWAQRRLARKARA